MKLWAGRFQKETDTLVNDFNASITFDSRLYKQDITGSIAHATMPSLRPAKWISAVGSAFFSAPAMASEIGRAHV